MRSKHAGDAQVNMHPCVRLSRYERDRVMSFVPPDGKFKLASYSVNTSGQVRPSPGSSGSLRSCTRSCSSFCTLLQRSCSLHSSWYYL